MKKLFIVLLAVLSAMQLSAGVTASGKIIHKSGEDDIMGTFQIGEWFINSEGELTVKMFNDRPTRDYGEEGGPWVNYADQITSLLVVASGIGEYAFANLPNVSKTCFVNVKSVKGDAFAGSFIPGHTLYFPDVTEVGDRAFKGCNAGIIITPNAETYGKQACSMCPMLFRVVCGDKIRYFDELCFSYCPMFWLDMTPNIIVSSMAPPTFVTLLEKSTWEKFKMWLNNAFVTAYEWIGLGALTLYTGGLMAAGFLTADIGAVNGTNKKEYENGARDMFMPYTRNWRIHDEYENIFFPKPDNELYTGQPVVAVPADKLQFYIANYGSVWTCTTNDLNGGYLVEGGTVDVDGVAEEEGLQRGVWMMAKKSTSKSIWEDAQPVVSDLESRTTLYVCTPDNNPMSTWSYKDGVPYRQCPWKACLDSGRIEYMAFMSTIVPDSLLAGYKNENTYVPVLLHPNTRHVGTAAFANSTARFDGDYGLTLDSCGKVDVAAFKNCTGIKGTVSIGKQENTTTVDATTYIGQEAFAETYVKHAYVNANRIFPSAFLNCIVLKDVTLYNTTEVLTEAFKNCSELREVNFGTRMSYLKDEAFSCCWELEGGHIYTNQYFVPEATEGTFQNLDRSKIHLHVPVANIDVFDKDPVFHPMIKNSDFVFPIEGEYWYISDSYNLHITGNVPDFGNPSEQPWAPYRRYITRIIVEEGVTEIGNNGLYFPDGSSLVQDICLDYSVKRLGNFALAGHPNAALYGKNGGITYIASDIKADEEGQRTVTYARIIGVETLGNNVFQDWTTLQIVYLDSEVKEMGDYVFKNCPIHYVCVKNKPAMISKFTFADIADNGQEGVITGDVQSDDYSLKWTYPLTNHWDKLHWLMGEKEIWYQDRLYGGNFILTSDSVMHVWPDEGVTAICPYYGPNGMPEENQVIDWRQKKASSTRIDFGENDKVFDKVKSIEVTGEPTYLGGIGCFLPNLSEVSLPESVKELNTTFYGCTGLDYINLQYIESLGRTDQYGSSYHDGNERVTIQGVFNGCEKLEGVYMPYVEYIGKWSFKNCYVLDDDLFYTNSPDTIAESAFTNCIGLEYLDLEWVESIGLNAFEGCTNLDHAKLGNNQPTYGMFAGCSKLKTVILGDQISYLDDNAFKGCPIETIVTTTPNPPLMGSLGYGTAADVFGDYDLSNIYVYTYPDYVAKYEEANGWKNMHIGVNGGWQYTVTIPTGAYMPQASSYANVKWEIQSDGKLLFTAEDRMKKTIMDPRIHFTSEYINHIIFNKGIMEVTPIRYEGDKEKAAGVINYDTRSKNIKEVTIPSSMQLMAPNLFGEAGVCFPNEKGTNHTITDVYCFAVTPPDISYSATSTGSMTIYRTAFGEQYLYNDETKNTDLKEQRIARLHVLHQDGVKAAYEAAEGYGHAFAEIVNDLTESGEPYEPKQYTVTFLGFGDKWVETMVVEEHTAAEAPATPVQEGYDFQGWDTDFSDVNADLVVRAQYTIHQYLVRFVDWDDTVLKSEYVPYNEAATPPEEEPVRTGFKFIGWDMDFSHVKVDLKVTAQYQSTVGIDQTESDTQKTEKILRDGVLYIVRGNKTYTILGQTTK